MVQILPSWVSWQQSAATSKPAPVASQVFAYEQRFGPHTYGYGLSGSPEQSSVLSGHSGGAGEHWSGVYPANDAIHSLSYGHALVPQTKGVNIIGHILGWGAWQHRSIEYPAVSAAGNQKLIPHMMVTSKYIHTTRVSLFSDFTSTSSSLIVHHRPYEE